MGVSMSAEDIDKEEMAMMTTQILKDHGHNLPPEEISRLINEKYGPPVSRAQRRVQANRAMTGSVRKSNADRSSQVMPVEGTADDINHVKTTIEFETVYY